MTRTFVVAKLDSSEYPSASKTVEENIAKIAGALKVEFVFGRYDFTEEAKMKDPEDIPFSH